MTELFVLQLLTLAYFLFLATGIWTLLWLKISEESRIKSVLKIKKVFEFILGDTIDVRLTPLDLIQQYPKAAGLYFGGIRDTIYLREAGKLESCHVFLHEIGHWTGHYNRNKRVLVGVDIYQSKEATVTQRYHYVREELIAEIISIKLRKYFGLPDISVRDRRYLRGWLEEYKKFFKKRDRGWSAESDELYIHFMKDYNKGYRSGSRKISKSGSEIKTKDLISGYRNILEEAEKGFKYVTRRKKNVTRINSYLFGKLTSSNVQL